MIEFFAAEDRERMRATLRASLRSGSPFDTEARIVTARGDPAWVRVLCEAEWDAREQVLRLVGAVQDISEAKRAESEILRLNTELEERIQQRTAQLRAVNAELNAFSYAVAHDPRAPLSTIDGSASCSPMGRASPIATITPSTGCC